MANANILKRLNEIETAVKLRREGDIYLGRADWSERLVRLDKKWTEQLSGFTSFQQYLENQEDRPHYPLKPEYRAMAASSDMADQAALYQLMLQRTRFL